MEELSAEVINFFKDDKEVIELQGRIKDAQKVHDETKARRTTEEGKLKEIEERHRQLQKELYMYKLTTELETLNCDINKEQGLYDRCCAKRKHVEQESERIHKSKSDLKLVINIFFIENKSFLL